MAAKWYNVEVIDKKSSLAKSCGVYMYARKSNTEGRVQIHNGRFFTGNYTQEEAKKLFKINSVLPESRQEAQEHDFLYYLHY